MHIYMYRFVLSAHKLVYNTPTKDTLSPFLRGLHVHLSSLWQPTHIGECDAAAGVGCGALWKRFAKSRFAKYQAMYQTISVQS